VRCRNCQPIVLSRASAISSFLRRQKILLQKSGGAQKQPAGAVSNVKWYLFFSIF